jgi:hypothetical protein
LRIKIAGLAAIEAVIVAILAQADVVLALAQTAIAPALALFFRLIALHANELVGHAAHCS